MFISKANTSQNGDVPCLLGRFLLRIIKKPMHIPSFILYILYIHVKATNVLQQNKKIYLIEVSKDFQSDSYFL